MGWFSELINDRKQKNQQLFEESFKNISSSVFGSAAHEDDPLIIALSQIFKHYGLTNPRIPKKLNNVSVELDAILSKHNLLTRAIRLEGDWAAENTEPILAFTKANHTPVVLFSKGQINYYFIHPKTGKKTTVTPQIADVFEIEATTFYHPLPPRRLTTKDYFHYIRKHIKISDFLLAIFLSALAVGAGMVLPYLTRIITGDVITNSDYRLFLIISLSMAGAAIAVLLIKTVQTFVNTRIAIKVEHTAHSALMMHLLSLPASFFKNKSTGDLNNRVSSITNLCNLLITGIFIAGLSAALSLAYLGEIAYFSLDLILPSLAVVLINLAFTIAITVIQRRVTEKQAKLAAEESGVTYDLIQGIQKIRLTGSEKRAFAKWATSYGKAARWQYNPPLIIKLAPVVSALISAAGGALIYYLVAKSGIDTPTFVAFSSAYGALSAALISLSDVVTNSIRVKPMVEMLRPILEAEPENEEGKKQVESLEGNIRLENIRFRYDENGPIILDDLSLDIKKGEYVAIVGKTGCGKSTIVRLLLGFEKPTSGHVYFDGTDIEELDLRSLRGKIGSVTQNGSLFHADIFHNIIITAPTLTEDDAWEAARIAQVADDIEQMPMKMHTMISEGQGGISGGQKQRIMIARAIVNKPRVLLFDEATSALDNRRQKEVADALSRLDCTRIVIAHRLSTIRQCDRILYIEGGKIVEEGTYDELLALNGRFKEMIERQKVE